MGGNRAGELKTLRNLMTTMVLGDIWRGAAWTFIIWGMLHGFGLIIHCLWAKWRPKTLPFAWLPIAWLLTFVWVLVTWVFFRSPSLNNSIEVLRSVCGFGDASNTFPRSLWCQIFVLLILHVLTNSSRILRIQSHVLLSQIRCPEANRLGAGAGAAGEGEVEVDVAVGFELR
jgi:D-alanyl-lipoteichoic acid acyltransferase DltB (MBOAT superfamily)